MQENAKKGTKWLHFPTTVLFTVLLGDYHSLLSTEKVLKHALDLVIFPRGSQCKIGQLINIEAARCLRRESWSWRFLRKKAFHCHLQG